MRPPAYTLLSAMADGAVLTVVDGTLRAGEVTPALATVEECLRQGWIYATRKPVVSGSSHTGRFLIHSRGRRAVQIMRRETRQRRAA